MDCRNISQRFWEINSTERLGSNATMLFFFLIKIYHENSQQSFSYSDVQICNEIGITRPTISSVREKLKNVGLITYETKRFHPCTYNIVLSVPDSGSNDITKKESTEHEEISEKSVESEIVSQNYVEESNVNEFVAPISELRSDNIIPRIDPRISFKAIEELKERVRLDELGIYEPVSHSLSSLLDQYNPPFISKKDNVSEYNEEHESYTGETDFMKRIKERNAKDPEIQRLIKEDIAKIREQFKEKRASHENDSNSNIQKNTEHKSDIKEEKISHHENYEEANKPNISTKINIDNASSNFVKNNKELKNNEGGIPSKEEFLAFAKTVEIYRPDLDFEITTKYETWVEDGWRDGHGREIKEWKSALKRTMPHFKGVSYGRNARVEPIVRPKNIFSK